MVPVANTAGIVVVACGEPNRQHWLSTLREAGMMAIDADPEQAEAFFRAPRGPTLILGLASPGSVRQWLQAGRQANACFGLLPVPSPADLLLEWPADREVVGLLPPDIPPGLLALVASGALRHLVLEQHQEWLAGCLKAGCDATSSAMILVDETLTIRHLNTAAWNLCGFADSMVGRPFSEIATDCGHKLLELLHSVLQNLDPIHDWKINCTGHQGEPLMIEVGMAPIPDRTGHPIGAVVAIQEWTSLATLPGETRGRSRFHRLVGNSRPMQGVYGIVESVGGMNTTVLITGESGTGKELVAEAIHLEGSRARFPMIKVNCSALSDTLLESELFGHVKGAFTGAVRERTGRFELADKGTLLLDEIGDISSHMQLRLLRVLQENELERVGDSRTIKVDVRIIAATNQDLLRKVEEGSFRKDLFYRLNVVEIPLAPLRERREDLPLLTEHFLTKFNDKHGRSISQVGSRVMEMFYDYSWPGNVRELEHVIEHAYVTCRQPVIKVRNLPEAFLSRVTRETPHHTSSLAKPDNEREGILRALEATRWEKNEAAKLLGISRSTLYRKMERLKIS